VRTLLHSVQLKFNLACNISELNRQYNIIILCIVLSIFIIIHLYFILYHKRFNQAQLKLNDIGTYIQPTYII